MRTRFSKIALAIAFGLALCFAQEAPEKLAVYVSGAGDAGINKSLGSKLLVAMTQSGEYSGIADQGSFQNELAKSGIAQISQVAKRHGADYVCSVDMVEAFGAYSINARLIKIAGSQVVKIGTTDRSLKSLDDLTAVSNELARQLLTQSSQMTTSSPQPPLVAETAPAPEPAEELPKPMSVAQALSSINLPGGCLADFTNLLGKDGFDMTNFMKELPVDVAKVKLQLKSPFGKPKDSDKTGLGLSVGCVKALPESPAEITFLLKDLGLKMGLDLAVDAVAGVADNSIPANVATNSSSGGGLSKPAIISIGIATVGLGAIIYGISKNSDVAHYVDERNGKAAVDAESSRNVGYGIGAALLAGGLTFYLVF